MSRRERILDALPANDQNRRLSGIVNLLANVETYPKGDQVDSYVFYDFNNAAMFDPASGDVTLMSARGHRLFVESVEHHYGYTPHGWIPV